MFRFLLKLFLVGIIFHNTAIAQSSLPPNVNDSLLHLWSNKKSPDTVRLKAMHIIAWNGYLFTQPDSAFHYAQLMFDFAKAKGRTKQMAEALNVQGISYHIQGDFVKAMEHFSRCLSLYKKINYLKGMADCLGNLGTVSHTQQEFALSIYYNEQGILIDKKLGNKIGIATSLNNIALSMSGQSDSAVAKGNMDYSRTKLDKAMKILNECLAIQREINNPQGIANALGNLGDVYLDKQEYDKALEYFIQSNELFQQVNDLQGMVSNFSNISNIYLIKKDYPKSIRYANKAMDLARELNGLIELSQSALVLWKAYKATGNHKLALDMHELYMTTRDSIRSEENQKEVIRQQFKYQYEKQAAADSVRASHEKKLKDVQIAKHQAEIKARKIQQYFLFGGLGFVLVFAGLIFNRFRLTKKQKQIIELQKVEVEVKNKEITDSINYAKRIQTAILPTSKSIHDRFPESFIFYRPKDIVAGDFYWFEQGTQNASQQVKKYYFAACDCTGHGVPGAMVSVVCNNGLNRSLKEFALTDPAKILDKTREIVIQEFEKSEEEVKDGMDMALCAFEFSDTNVKLNFAGANNPLWIVKSGTKVILEYKGDKQPVGKYLNQKPFTSHEIHVSKGDTLYMLTDGFPDQFGGPNGKKFKAKALKELLLSAQHLNMNDQFTFVQNAFDNWKKGYEQMDDVCLIGIRI